MFPEFIKYYSWPMAVAKLVEQSTGDLKRVGSNPADTGTRRKYMFLFLYQD
jgi:hypothetical protein